ncbi:hypothetical protein BH24GEM2_BH24GEM2_00660 [soil metagenome]
MARLAKLDAMTSHSAGGFEALISAIREEFGDLHESDFPLGVLERCYLGYPYEVHILDLSRASVLVPTDHAISPVDGNGPGVVPGAGARVVGNVIVRHYKVGEPLPPDFERARSLALHTAYQHVEVYMNTLMCVRLDGTVTPA